MTPSPGRYVPDGPLDEGTSPTLEDSQEVAEVGAADRTPALP